MSELLSGISKVKGRTQLLVLNEARDKLLYSLGGLTLKEIKGKREKNERRSLIMWVKNQ